MKSEHIIQLIRNLTMFHGLDSETIAEIATGGRITRFSRGEVLYKKGGACEGFYTVFYGKVRLSIFSKTGVERPLFVFGTGSSFGEATMFQDIPHYTTAIASDDSGLVFVPRDVIVHLLKRDWRFGMKIMANLASRLHSMVDDIDDFLLQPPAARLASYILRLIPPRSLDSKNVRLPLRKNLIASQINIRPETLSRYFGEFCKNGIMSLHGDQATIFCVDALCHYVAAPVDPPPEAPRFPGQN